MKQTQEMVNSLILVAAGSALGAAIRHALTSALENSPLARIATLPINIGGCFLAGLMVSLVPADAHPGWRVFLGGGFLGGFTTFSAFSLEVTALLGNAPVVAVAYALVKSMGCIVAALAGLWCGRLLPV